MKTTLKQRIKNLWKLSESESVKESEKFDIPITVAPINNTSFRYEGKPQGQIIKRTIEDEIKDILKDDENNPTK